MARSHPPSLRVLLALLGTTLVAACAAIENVLPSEPSAPVVRRAAGRRAGTSSPSTGSSEPRTEALGGTPGSPVSPKADVAPKSGPTPSVEDRRTFDEANRMRGAHGLAPFRWNDALFRAAYDHSAEQARHGYMGHGSPDPARDELADRLRFADCGAMRAWAEVVAWGYAGPATVVDGWMNSRGHRKILLDSNLEEAAFARVGDYFTGNFLTRR